MKSYAKLLVLCFCCCLVALSTCSRENPIHTSDDGPLEIRPLCKLASSLTIDEIGSAEALVSGKGIDGTLTFELLVNKTDSKLYGTLKLPKGATSCDVVIRMYDSQERKIGEGSYSLTKSHFDVGRCVTAEIGIESAKPRIDTAYAQVNPVGVNDSIALRAKASDSLGGTIQKYEWKLGPSAWVETSTGDTNIVAPSTAQAYACSLRVTDDDGNTAVDAVTVTVETRAPVAVTGPDTTVGINDVVNLRGSGSTDETGIVEYAWKCGDGAWLADADGDTTVIAPSTAQFWVCSLKVTDDEGNSSYAAQEAVVGNPTVIDADSNVYTFVIIGNQLWTVENLRTTKYNDGTSIPHVTDGAQWNNLSTPGYCWYNNSTDAAVNEKWGALYNWYAVNTGKLAPAGWRVPTDADWTQLEEYLIANGANWDGSTSGNKIGKSLAAKTDWSSQSTTTGNVGNDLSSNNSTGFSALPGGFRDFGGNFYSQSSNGYWWSTMGNVAASAGSRSLYYNGESLSSYGDSKKFGFSVRLVRDN